tara:strand:+ start:3005 stop:3250 length:246 start_codon:yes stop_codon:yes gene_type:complete
MTPLMFRGSVLIASKILSYSDFVNMRYDRFCKIEATYQFMNEFKNKESKPVKSEVKSKLDGLPTTPMSELSEDERNFLNAS